MPVSDEQRNLILDDLFGGVPDADYSAYEKILSDSRQRNRDNIMQQIAASDPRGMFTGDMLTKAISGNNASQEDILRNRILAGTVINSAPSIANAFGGSRIDMFSGINAGFQNSGVMSGVSYGNLSGIQGAGGLTDYLSRSVLNSLEESMYTATGAARVGMTSGLSRGDIGQVVAGLGLRGGLRPEAEFVRVSSQQQAQEMLTEMQADPQAAAANPLMIRNLEKAAEDPDFQGSTMLRQSSGSVRRIRELTEASSEAVAVMRSIIGPKGVPEVMDAIDSLLGEQVTTTDQARRATSKMEQLKNLSATGAGPVQGLLEQQRGFVDALGALGVTGPQAAMMAEDLTYQMSTIRGTQQTYQAAAAEAGIYVPDFDAARTGAIAARDAITLQTENPEVGAMLYAVQTAHGLDPAKREELMDSIMDINNVGDLTGQDAQDEMMRRISKANNLVEEYTGRSAQEVMRTTPDVQRRLDPIMRRQQADLNTEMIRRRTMDNFVEDITANDYLEEGFGRTEDQNKEFAQVVFGNLDRTQIMQIANDPSKTEEILNRSGLSDEDIAATRAQLEQVSPEFLKAASSTMSNEMLGTFVSKSEQVRANTRMLDAEINSMRFGGTDAASKGSFIGGLLGETNFSDTDVMEWLSRQGEDATTLGTMGEGGNIEWDMVALQKYTGLSEDQLNEMTSSAGGQRDLLDLLRKDGGGVGITDGEVLGAKSDSMRAGRESLDEALSEERFSVIMGRDEITDDEKDLLRRVNSGDQDAIAEYNKLKSKGFKSLQKDMSGLLNKAAKGDEDASSRLELVMQSGDADMARMVQQGISDTIAEKREKLSDMKPGRKATALESEISKLEDIRGTVDAGGRSTFNPSDALSMILRALEDLLSALRAKD